MLKNMESIKQPQEHYQIEELSKNFTQKRKMLPKKIFLIFQNQKKKNRPKGKGKKKSMEINKSLKIKYRLYIYGL